MFKAFQTAFSSGGRDLFFRVGWSVAGGSTVHGSTVIILLWACTCLWQSLSAFSTISCNTDIAEHFCSQMKSRTPTVSYI